MLSSASSFPSYLYGQPPQVQGWYGIGPIRLARGVAAYTITIHPQFSGASMTKKIVLVNPQLVSSGWNRGLRPQHMDDALPRHSLTYLSAALKRAGYTVTLADLRLLPDWNAYDDMLKREAPDVVCVTAHTSEQEAALTCLARAKRACPGCMTVAGGIHFTMFPHDALEDGHADYVLMGEGEISLPKLMENPNAFERAFWGETPDLDDLPFEDRELYPDYAQRVRFPLWDLPVPVVDLLTKRGCPWNCRFCCGPGEQNLFTRPSKRHPERRVPSIRHRSVSNVIAELEELYAKYRFVGVVFHDDQFLIRKNWVEEFCRALHNAGFVARGMRWWAACRADVICQHPDAIEQMRDAGLQIMSIGFESFSDRMLEWMEKETTREQNMQAAAFCHELGLDLFANVIFGMPYSDGRWYIEDDLMSIEAIREIRPRYFSPSFFSSIPGSWFHPWAVERELLTDGDWKRQGNRSPGEAKIKGVDYERLSGLIEALQREIGTGGETKKPLRLRLEHFIKKPFPEKMHSIRRRLGVVGS